MSADSDHGDGRSQVNRFIRLLDQHIQLYELFLTAEDLHQDLIRAVAEALCEFFTGEQPIDNFFRLDHLTPEELGIRMLVDECDSYWWYAYDMVYDIDYCLRTFTGGPIPPGTVLKQRHLRAPDCSEKAVEAEVREWMRRMEHPHPEIEESLRERITLNLFDKAYLYEYKMVIHRTLKQLALEYFPQIMELTAAGFRELDTRLFDYVRAIQGSLKDTLITAHEEWQALNQA